MSAFPSILVHLDSSARCAQRLQVARQLAETFDAQVDARYCVMPSLMRYPMSLEAGGAAVAIMEEVDTDRRARAHALYSVNSAGTSRMSWSEQTVEPPWGFATRSLYADLAVLGQRDPSDAAVNDVPPDFLPGLLVDGGTPSLVLPYAGPIGPIGKTVVVAWKETREAARAVHAALPWLRNAQEVHIVGFGEDTMGPLATLRAYLDAHGVTASLHPAGPDTHDAGEMLLSRTADLGADLLVMGCYGHSRARERVLGGMTRSILSAMTLPVLMVH